jgi:hypothetical protein
LRKDEGDIPREGLDVEIKVEIESDIDTEVFTAFVKGTNDGVEASLNFDLSGSRANVLDSVLNISSDSS